MAVEQQSERFFERLYQIPLVSFSIQKACEVYSTTKASNYLIEATFNVAENVTKFACDTSQPILRMLDGPIVATNKLACDQLNKLENNFPVIMSTPEELVNLSKGYLETSALKSKIDSTKEIKDITLQKVKEVGVDGQAKLTYFVDQCFGVSNAIIDTYFSVPPTEATDGASTSQIDNGSYASRFYNMTVKLNEGVRRRYIVPNLEFAQTSIMPHLEKLSSANMDNIKKVVSDVFHQLKDKSTASEITSGKVLLNLLHRSATTGNMIVDRIVLFSKPYLPEGVENQLESFVVYVRGFNDKIINAESLQEVKEKEIEELKMGVAFVQTFFVKSANGVLEALNSKILDQFKNVTTETKDKAN